MIMNSTPKKAASGGGVQVETCRVKISINSISYTGKVPINYITIINNNLSHSIVEASHYGNFYIDVVCGTLFSIVCNSGMNFTYSKGEWDVVAKDENRKCNVIYVNSDSVIGIQLN